MNSLGGIDLNDLRRSLIGALQGANSASVIVQSTSLPLHQNTLAVTEAPTRLDPEVAQFEIQSFIGQDAFGVSIDDSEELRSLIQKAEQCQPLPFEQKLFEIKKLALNSMRNAYELWRTSQDTQERKLSGMIVCDQNSLGKALQVQRGCCRYQSVLFLILGAAAKLGKKQYLQSAHVNSNLSTCFNDVVDDSGKVHHISIFSESLVNKELNYTRDGSIYERPTKCLRGAGYKFLAYTIEDGVVRKYSRQDQQFDYN